MNCCPLPFPTCGIPAGSNGGPPLAGAAVAAAGGGAAAAAGGAAGAAPPPNPHPVLPFWNWAPGPEQMPVGLAQQLLAQSTLLRHWPPINCPPCPFPTFLTPAGSKGGTAATKEMLKSAAMTKDAFIFAVIEVSKVAECVNEVVRKTRFFKNPLLCK
jgi:hypothetical protein